MDLHQLEQILEGGEIRRFHGHPVHVHQTNMHHGARVALFVRYLQPDASADLLITCIAHDAGEVATGDIPSPAKRNFPELKEVVKKIHREFEFMNDIPQLPPREQLLLKAGDYLETWLFCCQEAELGNRTMDGIVENCHRFLTEMLDEINCSGRLNNAINYLQERYTYARSR